MKKDKSLGADLAQLRYNQQFLAIAIMFLVSTLFWVGFGIFKSQQATTVAPQRIKLAEPLNPVLDVAVVEGLGNKLYFTESDLSSFTIYKLVSLEQEGSSRAIPIQQDESTLESLNPTPTPSPLLSDPLPASHGAAIMPIMTTESDAPISLP